MLDYTARLWHFGQKYVSRFDGARKIDRMAVPHVSQGWPRRWQTWCVQRHAFYQEVIVQKPAAIEFDKDVFSFTEGTQNRTPCQFFCRDVTSG